MKPLVFFLILISIYSCKKDNEQPQNTDAKYDTCLLNNISWNGNKISDFTYTDDKLTMANGKLIEYNDSGYIKDCEFSRYHMITYDNEGKIVYRKIASGGPAHTTVYYTDYYKYDNHKNVIQIIHHHWEDPQEIIGYDTFYYENNNIVRREYYNLNSDGSRNVISATDYTFDAKINPELYYERMLGPASVNNVVTAKNSWNGVISFSAAYTYKYNLSGYPVSADILYNNGQHDLYTFKYNCKNR